MTARTVGLITLTLGWLACRALPVRAASPGPGRPLDMAELVALKIPSEPRVSPDGRQVAFIVSWGDTSANKTRADLWVADFDGKRPPRRYTTSIENEKYPRWSPDGRWIAFQVNRARGSRPDGTVLDIAAGEARSQVWALPTDGGESVCLTDAPEGVSGFQWAPDGRSILYRTGETLTATAKKQRDDERKRGFDGKVEDADRKRQEFWRQTFSGAAPFSGTAPISGTATAAPNEPATRLFLGDYGIEDWDLSPDGRRIVYSTNSTGLSNDERRFDLWVLSIADSSARRLTTRGGPDTKPAWSPDGRWIAFQADQDTTVTFSQEEIYVVASAGGEVRCVTTRYDRSATTPLWISSPGASKREAAPCLVAESPLGPDNGYISIPWSGWPVEPAEIRSLANPTTAQQAPPDVRGARETYASELSVAPGGLRWAWIWEGTRSWPELYTGELPRPGQTTSPHRLTELNAGTPPVEPPAIQPMTWKSPDGLEMTGLLVRPPVGAGHAPYPTITYPHGGPFNRTTNRPRGMMTSLVLASRGYLVYHPNFRGSRGWSESFGQASRRDLGGGDLRDVLSGLDRLVADGLADSTRLGITGGSYGGYLTNLAIATTPRFKAAVSLYGIFNFVTDLSNSENPSFETEYFGGSYWDNFPLYYERSPFAHAKGIRTPTLLLHGDDDPNTNLTNSREMWTALKLLGTPVEFVHYPREKHGFTEPGHRTDAARRTVEWFDRYLQAPRP